MPRGIPTAGKRQPGGGRKPAARPLRHITVTLPAETIATLRQLGNGNVSAGVRRVVEERSGTPDQNHNGA